MTKPKGIEWIEAQTGTPVEFTPEVVAGRDRHLSVRLTAESAEALESMAAERRVTLSQLVRALLEDALAERAAVTSLDARALADRLAADVDEVRRRLAG